MEKLTPQEKAALIIWELAKLAQLSVNNIKFFHDIAIGKISENERRKLQQMISSILSDEFYMSNMFSREEEFTPVSPSVSKEGEGIDVALLTQIQPNLDNLGFGEGGSIAVGKPPSAATANLDLGRILSLSSLGMDVYQTDNLGGNEKMANNDNFKSVIAALQKEALEANKRGDVEVVREVKDTIAYVKLLRHKEATKKRAQTIRQALMRDIIKAELKGNMGKVAALEEKLARIEDGIRYLERDWNAFKNVNVFPKQQEDVVVMQYAKPEYNMGNEHIVNPTNILEPEGKIPDMPQFPSGNDKRVHDFKEAKPRIPMAGGGGDGSSISEVVGLETVKVLDEEGFVHQKPQPAVPDSLPKLASLNKNAQLSALIRELPNAVSKVISALNTHSGDISGVLRELGINDININDILQKLSGLAEALSKISELQEELTANKMYTIKVAGKYERVKKIVFPPTKDDPDGHFPINTEERARAAIAYVNKYTELPEWAKKRGIKSLRELVDTVVNAVEKEYPDINVSPLSHIPRPQQKKVAKKYERISPENIVFPATEHDDGHFPINTQQRAINALQRVNQYDELPPWARKRGIKSLQQLVNRVVRRVKRKAKEEGWDIDISEYSKSIRKKVNNPKRKKNNKSR